MIFFSEEEYRGIQDCGRDESGRFGPRNECQAPDKDGTQATAPTRSSSSWKRSSESLSWEGKDSPLRGGENLKSVGFNSPKSIAKGITKLLSKGSNVDDLVTIGGGAVRGGEIKIQGGPASGTDVVVQLEAPADPDDPESWTIGTDVTLYYDEDLGGSAVSYGTLDLWPAGEDMSRWSPPDDATVSRITSIMMERMTESMMTAESKGVLLAETLAIGSPEQRDKFKGYRLWPQFGFDGELPRSAIGLMEDDIEAVGLSPEARKKWDDGEPVTVQDLIATPQGKRWWNENGSAVDLRLDFRDKKSKGYKQFERMKALLPGLKRRNQNRNWFDPDTEFRDADCGQDEKGRFAAGNKCQEDAGKAASDNSWRSNQTASWKDDAPVQGGDQISSLTVSSPGQIPERLTLQDVVSIGGGAIRGSSISVASSEEGILVSQVSPVDPDDPGKGSFGTTVMFNDEFGQVDYSALSMMGGKSPEDVSDSDKIRVASILKERMLESMIAAEAKGYKTLSMQAVGSEGSDDLKGYRLWPQFGFDATLPRRIRASVPPELILRAAGVEVPKPGSSRIPHSQVLAGLARQVPDITVQQLIATREGKVWWDKNGGDIGLTLDLTDQSSPGYKRFQESKGRLPTLKKRNEGRDWVEWIEDLEFRAADCGRNEKGEFEKKNECQDGAGEGVNEEVKAAKQRNVDVMLGGGNRVAVIDEEARQRAARDAEANPRPDGSASGSTTDLWARTFVTRGGKSTNKITESDPVFPPDTHRQNGQFIAHEAVGQYLSDRDEEARRQVGADGPGAIIDTASENISEEQLQYLAEAITEDALHAYDVLGVDPGFYSTDLDETMRKMETRYPEFGTDPDARFIFTTLLAITSTGQGPDANLRDADDLYRMFREHGTVVPSNYGGGARDVTASLKVFQGLLDSFGKERTRRLLSGYTTAGKVEDAFGRLAGKSQAEEWRERTGSSAWSVPVTKKGEEKSMVSGELRDEVVPVAAIFGPKIGSFFANLSGRHDFLTMDRWLMRSVGRVSGELVTRSTPKQAKARAEEILKSLESGKWSRAKLFGVDKSHGITKADLIRSLKIQARTGVIEENGAAFIWATAAERSHQKTRRPTGGGYGEHEDPEIHDLHTSGNSLFKSLIHEQQDPKTGTARRNIREVFRRVQAEIESKTGRKADIDEIQAALWQYEKRLWKHLGAKTNITDNSLFSAAADGVLDGRLARSETHPRSKPFTPASRRDRRPDQEEEPEDEFDTNPFDAEQSAWNSDFAELGIDILEVLQMLEDDVEERRNFAALDAVVESRSADCGRQEGGKFGPGNQCQEEGDGPQSSRTTPHGKWNISEEPKEPSSDSRLATTHVVRLTGDDGTVKAYADVQMGGDNETLYVDFAWVAEPHRGKGIYKSLLESLQNEYTIVSDEVHNVATPVRKAYESLGAEINRYGSYELKKKKKDESRSADCGRQEGGKFGPGNQCQEDAGTATEGPPPTVQSASSRPITSGRQWKQVDGPTKFSGKDIPAKSLSEVKEVVLVEGRLLSKSLRKIGVSLSDAAKVCSANSPGATVSIAHGNIKEVAEFLGDPQSHQEAKNTVTFMTTVPISGIDEAVTVGTSLESDDGNLFLDYIMLDVSKEARGVSPVAIAREMMRSVARSVTEAEKIGVAGVYMTAARSDGDGHDFQGYKIWPRMGFDGVIPRGHITPTWSPALGFFSPYGYSIPNRILSPRAREEKKAGKLTVQALYETKEGQEWWEKNGRGMEMSLDVGVEDSPGWQRFLKMRDRVSRRDLSDEEFFAEMGVEFRSADFGRDERLGSARRRKDNTQTKVARKIYQMGMSEKGLKQMVRDLGGKVSHTLVEIDSTHKDEGINVFIRDRDYNESLVMHIGYYGADVYVDEVKTAAEVSRIESIVKEALPKTISKRLFAGGSPYPVTVVNSPGVDSDRFLGQPRQGKSAKQRYKDEHRSADCGRQEGGKFGPNNTCQEEGEGGSSSFGSTNDNQEFKGSDKPFQGSEKFQSVRVSGGSRVSQGLKSMGLEPGDALAVATGGQAGNSVFIRPAPEHSDKGEGATLFQYEMDVAGVSGGMFGSTVVANAGTKDSPEIVVYHSVAEVDDSIRKDDAKRHAAAREFYRTMTGSIEEAIRKGAKQVTLNAAGSAKNQNTFRGYTIWPRMGFDAPIPHHLKQKLPESLSHAKSLLDLHATPEGTRWWRDNGIDVDVSFDLTDQSSPQFKIMEKFRRKFGTERRDMPLGSGGEWLSPGDLALLDELWEEIWDDGDLDDYEWVERRSADCGRDEGGKFDNENTCQRASGSRPPAADKISQLASRGASRKELQSAIEKAIVGTSSLLGGYSPGESSPSEVCRALGLRVANEGDLDELMKNSWGHERRGIAAAIAQIHEGQKVDPDGLKGSTVRIDTAKSASEWIGVSRSELYGTLGAYVAAADTITLIAGNEEGDDHLQKLYESGYDSTPHPAHTLIHENAHRSHYQEIERMTGVKRPPQGSSRRDWASYSEKTDDLVYDRLLKEYNADNAWASRVDKKLEKVSFYAGTDPFEAVAEYSTAVRLGYLKNDTDLDRLCRASFAPIPRRVSR